ncbi:hypothetical protein [Azospirillum sp. SYSU D00513]|uniref:hypothetical protein n=1 Tax=Azospirillum sp. SYSU D00513 TaxID=2812561 RepID=UPI001A95D9E1|nr:hypothetical protein [Azospirillum sp. SYSU D00513]
MDSSPYIFAALVGATALFFGVSRARRHLEAVEARLENAVARRQAQVDRIRRAAQATLALARAIREAKRRKESLEAACEDLDQRLQAFNALDRSLYVLDDQRTGADLGWIARLSHPDYAGRVNGALVASAQESWKRGRRILVWALDEKKAREKLLARYPDHKGFVIHSVQEQED